MHSYNDAGDARSKRLLEHIVFHRMRLRMWIVFKGVNSSFVDLQERRGDVLLVEHPCTCTQDVHVLTAHRLPPRPRFHVRVGFAHVRLVFEGSKGPQRIAISAVLSRSKFWLGVQDELESNDDVR